MEKIVLDGIELPIRPTPLVHLMAELPHLVDGAENPEGAKALARAVYHGIRRAKGEVTQEFVSDNIDFTNFEEVMTVFARVNKIDKKKAGEPGEAEAGKAS